MTEDGIPGMINVGTSIRSAMLCIIRMAWIDRRIKTPTRALWARYYATAGRVPLYMHQAGAEL